MNKNSVKYDVLLLMAATMMAAAELGQPDELRARRKGTRNFEK